MERITIEQIAAYTGGKIYGDPGLSVCGVQIDSRKLAQGDLFVALKGERTDGHAFVLNALLSGTAALVKDDWARENSQKLPAGCGLIGVANPLEALQRLAASYRRTFNIPVVGVTGSCGKTTTKDMIAAVLGESLHVHKTAANFNNELGLSLTLLQLESRHQAAVLEMGMRGLGEISFLTSLAQPSIGVITNIGTTHLELLGTQENIARAKGELLAALPDDGAAVLNADDEWCYRLGQDSKIKVIYYGLENSKADLMAENIKPWGEQGTSFTVRYNDGTEAEVQLPLPGRHNVSNALAAIGAGLALGLSLAACARGLKDLRLSAMRWEISDGPWGSRIINDTYNANPASTQAALQVLAERSGDTARIAVLGSMFELGADSEPGHKRVGAYAAQRAGLTYLVTVGELAKMIAEGAVEAGMAQENVHSFAETEEALRFVQAHPVQRAWVLVKGSRGMKMEQIVNGLQKI